MNMTFILWIFIWIDFICGSAVCVESGPARGVISRLGENLEQETVLEDRIVEVLNQQEIKENLDSLGHYIGVIGTGIAAGLGTILGNTEQVIKAFQRNVCRIWSSQRGHQSSWRKSGEETVLEDHIVEVLNQQEIKENLDSLGHYIGVIAAGLGSILGNTEKVIKSFQRK